MTIIPKSGLGAAISAGVSSVVASLMVSLLGGRTPAWLLIVAFVGVNEPIGPTLVRGTGEVKAISGGHDWVQYYPALPKASRAEWQPLAHGVSPSGSAGSAKAASIDSTRRRATSNTARCFPQYSECLLSAFGAQHLRPPPPTTHHPALPRPPPPPPP